MILTDNLTPRDLLQKFYDDHQLGDEGGNHLPYVTLEITKNWKLYIPNWDERRKAVLRHDIHHILTEYESVLIGEFEIAAWEIASGCMNYWAAYLLNAGGLIAGMLFVPAKTFKAFIKGCRSKNLYQIDLNDETIKSTKISELKQKIQFTDNALNPSIFEIFKLISHFVFSGIVVIFSGIFIPFLFIYNIYMKVKLS